MDANRALTEKYFQSHPDDAAKFLEQRPMPEILGVLRIPPPDVAAGVIERMAGPIALDCLEKIGLEPAARILTRMEIGTAARFVRGMEAERRDATIAALDDDRKAAIARAVAYPEESAGAIMDTRFTALPADISVADGVKFLRKLSDKVTSYVYVVDREHALMGVINFRAMLMAEPELNISSVMIPAAHRIRADAGKREIIAGPAWRDFYALPVVDESGKLVGVIRGDQIIRWLEEDADINRPDPVQTALRLGELYWHGMAGILQMVQSLSRRPDSPVPK